MRVVQARNVGSAILSRISIAGGGVAKEKHDKTCGVRKSPLASLAVTISDRSRRLSFRSLALLGARGRGALAFIGALVLVVMRLCLTLTRSHQHTRVS